MLCSRPLCCQNRQTLPCHIPSRGATTFGWGKAIVDDYLFISAPGDPGDEGVFRSGTVFIYKVG